MLQGVERLEIDEVERPTFDGESFGAAGPYERVSGRAHCVLDPDDPLNAPIALLRQAPRDARGRVAYTVDFALLKPIDPARGNGWLLYDVPNRGNKMALHRLNGGPATNRPSTRADAGTGFLMRCGYTLAWSAWQGDVPAGADRLLATLPVATDAGRPLTGVVRDEFIAEATGQVGDEVITPVSPSQFIARLSYPAASLDPAGARLTVRQRERDPRAAPPDLAWRFVDARRIEVTRPDGFDRGAIYEFIYRGRDPLVLGIGFAAIRDVVAFLRRETADPSGTPNPLAPGGRNAIGHALGFGLSQSGRVLRDLVHLGFNQDLAGRAVFDAVFPVVCGARGTYVNYPFAQPGRYSRQHEDHAFPGDQFPFAFAALTDPVSGGAGGLLDRAKAAGVCPKIMQLDTESELWAGRGSLIATDCAGHDIAQPEEVRIYLATSLQHAPRNPDPSVIKHRANPIGYGALMRALLVALTDWAGRGIAPPPSRFPARADGGLVPLEAARAGFPRIPGLAYPARLNAVRCTDYAAAPPGEGAAYPLFVAPADADGNALGGLRHPVVQAPLGTHTGWNLRAAGFAEDELYSIVGSFLPFAATEAERRAAGDPRPSLAARYGTRDGWVARLKAACDALVADRLLLAEDAARLIEAAARSWDVFDAI